MIDHPNVALFPTCPHEHARIRKAVGDRFCPDSSVPGAVVSLQTCLACPLAGTVGPVPPRRPLVGQALSELLATRYRATVTPTCNCGPRMQQMNEWGPDGCEQNIDTIVDWLIEAAAAVGDVRSLAPDWAKRWKLRPFVRKAIKIVREWTPEG